MDFNESHIKEIAEIGERSKSNERRIEKAEQDIESIKRWEQDVHDIATSVQSLAKSMVDVKDDITNIEKKQDEMRTDIQSLKAAPIKKKAAAFDGLWKYVATAIGGAVVSFLIATLFPMLVK